MCRKQRVDGAHRSTLNHRVNKEPGYPVFVGAAAGILGNARLGEGQDKRKASGVIPVSRWKIRLK